MIEYPARELAARLRKAKADPKFKAMEDKVIASMPEPLRSQMQQLSDDSFRRNSCV